MKLVDQELRKIITESIEESVEQDLAERYLRIHIRQALVESNGRLDEFSLNKIKKVFGALKSGKVGDKVKQTAKSMLNLKGKGLNIPKEHTRALKEALKIINKISAKMLELGIGMNPKRVTTPMDIIAMKKEVPKFRPAAEKAMKLIESVMTSPTWVALEAYHQKTGLYYYNDIKKIVRGIKNINDIQHGKKRNLKAQYWIWPWPTQPIAQVLEPAKGPLAKLFGKKQAKFTGF